MEIQKLLTLGLAAKVLLCSSTAHGVSVSFFSASQTVTNVASGSTSDTIASEGYLITYSMDKWWYPTISLGPGEPTGRPRRIFWPDGVEAQAVTAGPSGQVTSQSKARITLKRADGQPFDLKSFRAKLLANTAGAGGAFEIMPKLNGEDGLPDPISFNATGNAGNVFSYTTPALLGFDTYDITLYVDFALTAFTAEDASLPPPALQISMPTPDAIQLAWPAENTGFALQASPDAIPAHFTNTGIAPILEAGWHVVTWPLTNSMRVFRLVK